MSRPVFIKIIDGKKYRIAVTDFDDPEGGTIGWMDQSPGPYDRPKNEPKRMLLKDLWLVSGTAIEGLKLRGYDLDGVRAGFWVYELNGWDVQLRLCQILGDEYRFDFETPPIGVIRRVIPRGAQI